ncbi:MAG: hypothetical protein QME05_04665 [Candidatus Margulisbacteria bacterium]|nr:hypothetical protein [Candidatus Margulisiibacteriota bacterium]
MKKIFVLSLLVIFAASCVFAATAKTTTKKTTTTKPKVVAKPVVITVAPQKPSLAYLVKGGFTGGGGELGLTLHKLVNDRLSINGDLGYIIGSGYSTAVIGASVVTPIRGNLGIGLMVNYSSFSQAVRISGIGDITSLSGVGFGALIEYDINNDWCAHVGYDTRLGLVAELGYAFSKR